MENIFEPKIPLINKIIHDRRNFSNIGINNLNLSTNSKVLFKEIAPDGIGPDSFIKSLNEIRAKIKSGLDIKSMLPIVMSYVKAIEVSKPITNFWYDEKLIENFTIYKKFFYKNLKTEVPKKDKNEIGKLYNSVDDMILHIQNLHNSCNLMFDILNTKESYVRKQMINYNGELEKLKEAGIVTPNIYSIYRQFNDIRNIFIHEDYYSIIIMLNLEDLINIINLLKMIENANVQMIQRNCQKYREIFKGFDLEKDEKFYALIERSEKIFQENLFKKIEVSNVKNFKKKN